MQLYRFINTCEMNGFMIRLIRFEIIGDIFLTINLILGLYWEYFPISTYIRRFRKKWGSLYRTDLVGCSDFIQSYQELTLVSDTKQRLVVTIYAVHLQLPSKIIAPVTGDRV